MPFCASSNLSASVWTCRWQAQQGVNPANCEVPLINSLPLSCAHHVKMWTASQRLHADDLGPFFIPNFLWAARCDSDRVPMLYLFLLGSLIQRTALVNFMLRGHLAHQANGLLVILTIDAELLLVKPATVSTHLLHVVLVRCYLQRQIDGRSFGNRHQLTHRTLLTSFPFPELLQANFANVMSTTEENGEAVDVRTPGTNEVLSGDDAVRRHYLEEGRSCESSVRVGPCCSSGPLSARVSFRTHCHHQCWRTCQTGSMRARFIAYTCRK